MDAAIINNKVRNKSIGCRISRDRCIDNRIKQNYEYLKKRPFLRSGYNWINNERLTNIDYIFFRFSIKEIRSQNLANRVKIT
jgi:hypothetical protein